MIKILARNNILKRYCHHHSKTVFVDISNKQINDLMDQNKQILSKLDKFEITSNKLSRNNSDKFSAVKDMLFIMVFSTGLINIANAILLLR